MCENVNINVSETNETINIVSSEIQEVIDINVFETTEDVTLNITEQLIQVNINKVTGSEQIQSDWAQTDNEALDFIKNKPTIPDAVTNTSDLINDGEDGVNPFITANDIPPVTGFVPYTGATDDVDLGTHDLTATQGTFATSGNPDTLTVNHSSGSGKALTITKGGAGEGIYVNKTSGSGNAVTIVGDLEATNLKRTGGTSSQFLKADGSVDSNTYFELPALTSGSVLFSNGTTIAQDNAQLFWDDTNNRLGIGTTNFVGSIKLAVNGQIGGPTFSSTFLNLTGGTPELRGNSGIGFYGAGGNIIFYGTASAERMRLFANGNLAINTTTDAGYRLDVNGTARVTGNLTIDNLNCNAVRGSFFNTFNNGYTVFQSFTASGNAAFYNSVSVGTTATPVASAVLEAVSTTKGFLPPRMTTTQKNAIATPAAGLVVYDTDLNQLCTYDGTWGDSPFYQQSLRGVRFFTDFDSSSSYDNFVSLVSGVAAATNRLNNNVPNQTANQIGIAQYQTGTAVTGVAMHITEASANAMQFQLGGGTWMYESYIEVATLSDVTDGFRFTSGFGNLATAAGETNGVFFTYDEGGTANGTIASPNWQCVTTVGAVRTLTTTSVAVTTTWTKLRIIVNADATEVKFYIDGILVATHTTNIPVLPTRIKVLQKLAKTLGTGNRFVYCDYIFYENNLTTLR